MTSSEKIERKCGDCGRDLSKLGVGYLCDRVPTKAGEKRPWRCAGCADEVCTEEKHGESCNTNHDVLRRSTMTRWYWELALFRFRESCRTTGQRVSP